MPARIELTKAQAKQLVKQYSNGSSMDELSYEWGYSVATVRRLLEESGATIRPRGRQPQS